MTSKPHRPKRPPTSHRSSSSLPDELLPPTNCRDLGAPKRRRRPRCLPLWPAKAAGANGACVPFCFGFSQNSALHRNARKLAWTFFLRVTLFEGPPEATIGVIARMILSLNIVSPLPESWDTPWLAPSDPGTRCITMARSVSLEIFAKRKGEPNFSTVPSCEVDVTNNQETLI